MPPPRTPDDAVAAWARAHAATVAGGPSLAPSPRPTGPWHLEMDAEARSLGEAAIAAVGERPGGTAVVATVSDRRIRWWDPRDGTLLADRSTPRVHWLAFTPPTVDPPRMVSIDRGGDETLVRVWDLSSFTPTIDHRVPGQVPEKCLVRSPGGSVLLASNDGPAIELHDLESGQLVERIVTGMESATWAFSAAATLDDVVIAQANDERAVIASAAWSSTIELDLTDYPTELSSPNVTLISHGQQQQLVLTISGLSTTHLWDVNRGVARSSGSLPTGLPYSAVSIAGGDGPVLHIAGADEISCWNAETLDRLAVVQVPGTSLEVDAHLNDGTLTVVATPWALGEAHVWTGRIVRPAAPRTHLATKVAYDWSGVHLANDTPRELRGMPGGVWSVCWRPHVDGVAPRLAAANTGRARIWDLETSEVLATLEAGSLSRTALHWSPDGQHLAGVARGDLVQVWRSSDFALVDERSFGDGSETVSLRWSPDGRHLAVTDRRRAHLWQPFTPEPPVSAAFDRSQSNWEVQVVWSRSGDVVLITAGTGVNVWEPPARTMTMLASADGAAGPLAIEWSPTDDRAALVTFRDSAVVILDARSDRELVRLRGHTEHPWSVRWSVDGGCIVSVGDRTARLWDPRAGTELLRIDHPANVRCAELYEDVPGHAWLATGGHDDVIRVWELGGIQPVAGAAPGPYVRPRELDGTVRVLVRLADAGVHPPLGLLADLVAVLGGKPPGDERLLTIADWAGVARLRALGWPAPARGGLAALLVTETDANPALIPPDGAAPGALRAALDAAIETTPGAPPPPPLGAVRRAAAAVTDELVGLLAVVGPEAVAGDPALPLRLRDGATSATTIDVDQRAALLAAPPPTGGPGRRRTHSPMPGFDLAGIARSGRPSALLPSQLALPEDVLTARLLTADLHYRHYDHPVDPAAGALALVLDTGPATYGPVEALLRLATHRITQHMWHRGSHVVLYTTDLPGIPRELHTPADLAHIWSSRTLTTTDLTTTITTAHRTALPLLVAAHHHTVHDHAIHPDTHLALLTTHTPGEPLPHATTHPRHRHLPPNTPPTELDHHLQPLLPT